MSSLFKKHCDALGDELKSEIRALREEVYLQRNRVQTLEEENQVLRNRVNQLDRRSRQNNLIIHGLRGVDGMEENVKKTLEESLEVQIHQFAVSDIHRLGKDRKGPILLELNSSIVKQNILQKVSKLKGTAISISPDYTLEEREQRRILVKRMKESIEERNSARIEGNKLIINNKQYTLQQIIEENKKRTDVERPEVHGSVHKQRELRPRTTKGQ